MIEIPDNDHSPLGPSSAERWMNCPGSVAACAAVSVPPSKYAAEGTAAHTLSEWVRALDIPAEHFKGHVLRVDGFEFKVGKAMIEGVQTFVDSCAEIPGDPHYEVRVHYDEWVPRGFGTADDVRLDDGLCVTTDLKYGTGVKVFAKDNAQLKMYSLGAFATFRDLYEFGKIVLRVSQPRLRHFEEWETTIGQLLQWAYDEVRPAARLALSPDAPIKAGPWCKFCKIKDSCLVRAEYKREFETGSGFPGRVTDPTTEFTNLEDESNER